MSQPLNLDALERDALTHGKLSWKDAHALVSHARTLAYQVARLQASATLQAAAPEEQWAPMTDEQRARWKQTGLFPVEKWNKGADSTPLVCPMPTNEELRALASAVPEHIQLSGWYIGKPAFGHRYLYADNFRGMGRQWVCAFHSDKGYFDGLADYVAAAHPRTVIRLLDRIAELEGQPQVTQQAEPIYQYRHRNEVGELESERWMDCDADEYARFAQWPEIERRIVYAAPAPSASPADAHDIPGLLAMSDQRGIVSLVFESEHASQRFMRTYNCTVASLRASKEGA